MGLKNLIKGFVADERGQSTTEYILILSVVVMVALKFKKEFEPLLTRLVGRLGTDIDDGIKEGSTP